MFEESLKFFEVSDVAEIEVDVLGPVWIPYRIESYLEGNLSPWSKLTAL
jgi:hypothetical protein